MISSYPATNNPQDSFLNSMFSPFYPQKYHFCKAACGYSCLFTTVSIFLSLIPECNLPPRACCNGYHCLTLAPRFLLTTPPVSDCQWKRTTRPTVGTVRAPLSRRTRRRRCWKASGTDFPLKYMDLLQLFWLDGLEIPGRDLRTC